MGCDQDAVDQLDDQLVSIHAPRVGCDTFVALVMRAPLRFQFTHPVWGAT